MIKVKDVLLSSKYEISALRLEGKEVEMKEFYSKMGGLFLMEVKALQGAMFL